MRKAFLRYIPMIMGCVLAAACAKESYIAPCSLPDSSATILSFPGGTPDALQKAFRLRVGNIASPGEKFDSTDVVKTGRNRRVIFVWNRGLDYVIATEQGGIAYNDPVFLHRIDPQNRMAILVSENVAFPTNVCEVSRRLLSVR